MPDPESRPGPTLDVLCIGNAIVDVLATVPDDFLVRQDLVKGSMALVEAERAESLYAALPPGVETSGGSAGNTAVGVAALGGRAAFVGKVRDDQLGAVFAHDIRAAGVRFDNPPASAGPPTARCLIAVTPDAQRTMSTYLGIASEVAVADVERAPIPDAAITYCEGYLWDREGTKEAIRRAAAIAHDAGRLVSLTLSDGFCVERHRDEFLELATTTVDVLFANEAEICALHQAGHYDDALQAVRATGRLAFLTRGEHGAVVVRGDELHVVGPHHLGPVIDTTGAGDQFAAGALVGLGRGYDLATCARLGALAAGEVIAHLGPRPAQNLRQLAAKELGLRL